MSEIEEYQHGLKNKLFSIAHNRTHRDPQNTDDYVAYSIEGPVRDYLHFWYTFQTVQDFDFEWYAQCTEYLNSLHPSDKYRIRCYSKISDEFVNSYLRNPDDFLHLSVSVVLQKMHDSSLYFFLPDMLDTSEYIDDSGKVVEHRREELRTLVSSRISNMSDLIPFIQRYTDHLRRIIQGAPRLTQDILVFRGVKTDYLPLKTAGVFRGFTSTTWYPRIAYEFGLANMIYELIVSKETPALCIHGISEHDEYEVLLDTDIYGIADRAYLKYYLDIYPGSGEFPTEHMWNPDTTDVEGPEKRITVQSRVVFVHPDAGALPEQIGGRTKNRTSLRITRKSYTSRKSSRKSIRIMYDPKDPSAATFVPTSAPMLLRKLHAYQSRNPRKQS